MDEDHDLFSNAWLPIQNDLVVLFIGLDEGVVLFKGICKNIGLAFLFYRFLTLFLQKAIIPMIFVQMSVVFFFDMGLVKAVVFVDEAQLEFLPKLVVYLVKVIYVVLEGL